MAGRAARVQQKVQTMKTVLWTMAALGLQGLAGCAGQAASPVAPAQVARAKPPVLKTQDFESGRAVMAETPSPALEEFLHDLSTRWRYDRSQHDGRPGPDGPYLSAWIGRVTQELLRRGYYVNEEGDLCRPG